MIKEKICKKVWIHFLCLFIFLVSVFFISINTGSISIGIVKLCKGLFVAYDEDVAVVYDLRFPRILISMMAGAGLAVAGVLFQAVLKNPLADPGLLGISSGCHLATIVATAFLPQFFWAGTIFSVIGGVLAFGTIYFLAWKGNSSTLRIILMGVAMQALFSGLGTMISSLGGKNASGAASIVEGNVSLKTWLDVKVLLGVILIGEFLAFGSAKWCNLCGLEDKTVRNLGVNVDQVRLFVSMIAIFLVGGCTAIVGPVNFLGLLVPHIGRIFVGSDHRKLIPFSVLLGALLFLSADTIGRSIAYPYEISASVILSVAGGIIFIFLLRKDGGIYGK